MNYSKFAFVVPFGFAVFAAGCGKMATTDNTAATQPSSTTTSPVATTPPAAATPSVTATSPAASPAPQTDVVATLPPGPEVPVQSQLQSNNNSSPASVQQFAQDRRSAQDLAAFTFTQKSDFVQAMTVARDQLNQELVQLSAKVDLASDAVKTEERSKLGTLQTELNELDAKLDQVKVSSESDWDQVKAGAQQAYEHTRQSMQDMNQRLAQSATLPIPS